MKNYYYFQPNEKQSKAGDCQIRALCKALDKSWVEVFDLIYPICREMQITDPFDGGAKVAKEALKKLGFEYTGISNKKGNKRPTVKSFALAHRKGTYIVTVANHVCCVKDGIYYDSWDCGECSLYGYYEKVRYKE